MIALLSGISQFTLNGLISSITPLVHNVSWYATAYIIFSLFIPYLDRAINNLEKNEIKRLLFMFGAIWVVIPFATNNYTISAKNHASNLVWFSFIYILTKYIKRYLCFEKISKYKMALILLGIYAVEMLFVLISYKVGFDTKYLAPINSPLTLALAYAWFGMFVGTDFKWFNRVVGYIASLTFGIYLIHDNPLVNKLIWQQLCGIQNCYSNRYFSIWVVAFVLVVFCVCGTVESLRKILLGFPEKKLVCWIDNKLTKRCEKANEKFN